MGPFIVVLKTHIDIVSDFSQATIDGLVKLSQKHDFLLFEDRKFIDIGSTVQKQYRGGALRIHDWAHIINASVLAGEGIIQALDQTITAAQTPDRGILILARMTSKGSLATGDYTTESVRIARRHPDTVIGFVASLQENDPAFSQTSIGREDFVVFTTGINLATKGDTLGQQYETPAEAMSRGADFLIAGRGIYAAADAVASARAYQQAGWEAYLRRVGLAG